MTEPIAFDRSERFKDQDGHLHVRASNLSKATVNPYRGTEIPNWQQLGLEPERIYNLLRHPDELAKGAASFNNLRLMSKHVAVSATDTHEKEVAGSTGTDARFEDPYLINSLVIWRKQDIEDVESQEKCQLSCGYYYDADMMPGTFRGLRYDGVMRNIRGNHVALVEAGRAGPDVLVHDTRENIMPLASRKALIVKGALAAYLKPKMLPGTVLALDSVLGSVNGANWKTQKPVVLAAVTALAKPKLAQDASLDDLDRFIGALDAEEEDKEAEDEMEAMDAEEEEEEKKARDEEEKEGKSAEDRKKGARDRKAARDAKRAMDAKSAKDKAAKDKAARDKAARDAARARDEETPEERERKEAEDKAKDKKAMDSAIADAEQRVVQRMTAAAEARELVRPIVGNLSMALDSAAAIYETTLKMKGVDTTGVHPSALRAMVQMLPKPGSERAKPVFDSAAPTLDTMFPGISRINL
jgi:uncharacterized protein